jgi:CRISPR/Cas system CSM-associated protein Csm5 (group 7 of RAMP superfamily)
MWQNIVYQLLTNRTMAAFKGQEYLIEVVTPVHIGASKENDYIQGQDYFVDNNAFHFVKKKQLQKCFTPEQITKYTQALLTNNTSETDRIIKEVALKNPKLIYHASDVVVSKTEIKKHISDGFGNLYIPGSSFKGALRSIIGVDYEIKPSTKNDFDFGNINDNLMRFIQVSDIAFYTIGGNITPVKVYSGDIEGNYASNGNYKGYGAWKDKSKNGHEVKFNSSNFVTLTETIATGSTSLVRINVADDLIKLIQKDLAKKIASEKARPDDKQKVEVKNAFVDKYNHFSFVELIRKASDIYLEGEIKYFEKFKNDAYSEVITQLKELKKLNNVEDSALLRLGAGSGFHAITGNWKYKNDHANTEKAPPRKERGELVHIEAISSKTRKVNFTNDKNGMVFSLPGFVKISLVSEEVIEIQKDKLNVLKNAKEEAEKAILEAATLALEAERKEAEENIRQEKEQKEKQEKEFQAKKQEAQNSLSNLEFDKALELFSDAMKIKDDGTFPDFKAKVNLSKSEEEVKNYSTTIQMASLEAYNAFLTKYVISEHRPEIERLRNTLSKQAAFPEKFYKMTEFEQFIIQFPKWTKDLEGKTVLNTPFEKETIETIIRIGVLEISKNNSKSKLWRERKHEKKIAEWLGVEKTKMILDKILNA